MVSEKRSENQNKEAPGQVAATTFQSILFEDGAKAGDPSVPAFFADLDLDQVIDAITRGKEEYDLKPFFYTSLKDIRTIEYRHQIMRDLEDHTLFDNIRSFAQGMQTVRQYLALVDKLSYKYQKERWFLDAVGVYCDVVNCLLRDLSDAELKSRGIIALREYLSAYVRSDRFTSLLTETEKVKADLSTVSYSLIIRGGSFTARKYDSEADYSAEVERTFAKFKSRRDPDLAGQGAVNDYRIKFSDPLEMNHIEAQVLAFVAQLYPQIFSSLDDYSKRNGTFLDETIAAFDREIQFYVAYLEYISTVKRAGLKFCYPQITEADKNVPKGAMQLYDYECFDLALAHKLVMENLPVVCNDFYLAGEERIFVVTGPNQGGKTTFARTFGQLYYLASLGCPVPGREARLSVFDEIFTHFEKQEKMTSLRGKLEDDLIRIHNILENATANSIIIMNEIFTSTTLQDAIFLSRKVLQKIIDLGCLAVCVTFIDELVSMSDSTVSVASTVEPENSAVRTFKILRKPADGLAYAMSIAEKYRVTYEQLKRRMT
ncbi:MAG: DNA mismatch repair protein MutS [Bacteroidetes bacterium]|nr:DNA mismatch repair protein MutS [Bacteroidota bacterium]